MHKKTLFLYYGSQFFHKFLADAIEAEPYPSIHSKIKFLLPLELLYGLVKLPKDYDLYLCEHTFVFPALARKLGLIKNAKIANIFADSLLYYLTEGKYNFLVRSFYLTMLKEVDYGVCVGKMEEKLLKKLNQGVKTIVVYPYVRDELKIALMNIDTLPNLDSKRLLFCNHF